MTKDTLKQHPSLRYHNILAALCKPLKSIGVSFFAYTSVDKHGHAHCLGSKADYAEAYLRQSQFNNDVHRYAPTHGKEFHYRFWDFAKLDQRNQKLYRLASEFDQSHTLTVTRYTDDITHCYHFSGHVSDVGLNQRYIDKLDILHCFIDFFNNCLHDIPEISAIYEHPNQLKRNALLNLRASDTVNIVDMHPGRLDLPTLAKKEIRFKNISEFYLSTNERRCLYWLHRGKSADMIAEILNVSRKTVERYVASIKDKYGCYSLYQLGGRITEMGLNEFL